MSGKSDHPLQIRPLRLRRSLIVGLALAASACSGGSSSDSSAQPDDSAPDLAFSDNAQLELSRDLNELEIELIDFEASWICAAPQLVFDDSTSIEDERDERLAQAGIDQQDYVEFQKGLEDDEDLRKAVMNGYQQGC